MSTTKHRNDWIDTLARESVNSSDRSRILRLAFTRFQAMVYSTALTITGRSSDAEDVLQDVFLVLNARYEDIELEKLPGWLKAVAIRVALNSVRKRGRREQLGGAQAWGETSDPVVVTALSVQAMLEQLSEELRVALLAKYALGWTLEELAAELEVSVATAGRRVQRAVLRARQLAEVGG